MRIKLIPEDFRVRELLEFREVPDGAHYVHELHKEKLSTQEALASLAQHAQIDRAAIAYAGLKDRQAVTDQFISIEGSAVDLRLPGLRVRPVGRTDEPVKSRQSRGNAFTVVVRDLQPAEAAQVRRALPSLQTTGFPNYFDDQRFGCLRHGQGFAMREVLRGDYEAALAQLVATPSPRAISGDVKLKQALERHWGDWQTCLRIVRGPIYEPLFRHLCEHPDDFRGALGFLPVRQRVIHSFAYQSLLWNRAVSRLLHGGVPSAQRLRISTIAGDLLAWKYLAPEREQKLAAMETPLYGPEGAGGSEPFRRAMEAVLERAGHTREAFLDHQVPGMVWREEPRTVLIKPADLEEARIAPDELHAGRVKVTLSFALPRGAYATMLLKRLFAPPFHAGAGRQKAGAERRGSRPGWREAGEERARPPHRPREGFRGPRPGRPGPARLRPARQEGSWPRHGRAEREPAGPRRFGRGAASERRATPWQSIEEEYEG